MRYCFLSTFSLGIPYICIIQEAPVCFSTVCGLCCLPFHKSQAFQFAKSGPWQFPLLPDTHTNSSIQPPIQVCDVGFHVRNTIIIKPATHEHFDSCHCLLDDTVYNCWNAKLVRQSYPRMRPYMRFLYVRPEFCPRDSKFPESSFLQIPPHGGHPCLRLCPSHYHADSGLAPVRNMRRWAHITGTDFLKLCIALVSCLCAFGKFQ